MSAITPARTPILPAERLAELGYRVDTQVRVGTKRIDLVVEGAEDRRPAAFPGEPHHT